MQLKAAIIVTVFAIIISACHTKNNTTTTKASFCDTICMKDSLKYIDNANKLKPYVYISAKNCSGDTLTWGYSGVNKNIPFDYKLRKDYTRCYIKDTSFALLMFNTCENGRGYFMKLSFARQSSFRKSTTAINNFDPKFAVADSLLAYTDKGNIFIEDYKNDKKALVTFGKPLDFDFDVIHETLDSVNITRNHVWAKFKMDGNWQIIDKDIKLE
jgi:hypothetical protein